MREIFGRKVVGSTGPVGHSGIPGPSGVRGPVWSASVGVTGYSGVSAVSCYSGRGGKSGVSGFSGEAGFSGWSSRPHPWPCSGCHGFSGVGPDTARFTFTVGDRDWTDVCMFIKEGLQVEALPGDVLWRVEGEQDGVGRKMTESATLSLVANDDGTGKILVTVSDGSTYDVTRKSLAYVPDVPGKPHPGYDHDDGLLWVNTPLGAFEAKLKVEKTKVTVRDFSLAIPDDAAGYIGYYDGYFLMYFDAGKPFGCDETERGLAHDAVFASVVEAEWRRKCAYGGRESHCQCENCNRVCQEHGIFAR